MKQSKKLWIAIGIAIMLCVTIGLTACGEKTQEHNLIFHEAKNASCTEDGNTAYWSCQRPSPSDSRLDRTEDSYAEKERTRAISQLEQDGIGMDEHWL